MSTTEALATIHKSITVQASPETAFETFTRGAATWWPVATHSIHHEDVADLVFERRVGGIVYERTADGREAEWADVVAWEPPHRVVLRWRVNPASTPTEVEVRFTPEGDATRVDLEHRGWDDAESRANYDTGWDRVLAPFVAAFQSVSE